MTRRGKAKEEGKRGVEVRVVIDFWKVSTVVFLLLSAFLILYYGVFSHNNSHNQNTYSQYLSQQEVASKMKGFIQEYILNNKNIVEVTNVTDVSGLYRIELRVGNETGYVFATHDAKYMFLPIISQGNVYLQVIDTEKFKEVVEKLRKEGKLNSTALPLNK